MAKFNYESEQLKPYVEANKGKYKYLCDYHHDVFQSGVPCGTLPDTPTVPDTPPITPSATLTNLIPERTTTINSGTGAWSIALNVNLDANLQPNTTYTFFNLSSTIIGLHLAVVTTSGSEIQIASANKDEKYVFTVSEECSGFRIYTAENMPSTTIYDMFMIIEGNHLNEDIPYFVGTYDGNSIEMITNTNLHQSAYHLGSSGVWQTNNNPYLNGRFKLNNVTQLKITATGTLQYCRVAYYKGTTFVKRDIMAIASNVINLETGVTEIIISNEVGTNYRLTCNDGGTFEPLDINY